MTDVNPDRVLDGPALHPPPGVLSNFDDPQNMNGYTHASLRMCLVFSSVAVAGRVYARWILLKKPHIGDWMFVHQWDVRVRDLASFMRITFVTTNVFFIFIAAIKAAIALEWIHLFSPNRSSKSVFWSSHLIIWVNVIFYMLCLIFHNIDCVPYERSWNKLIPGACDRADTGGDTLASAVISVATDVLLLIIPQRVIWGLHTSMQIKLGVSVVFAIGIFACITATARLVFAVRRSASADFTYTASAVILCAIAEGLCGILVMCIPSFPKVFASLDLSHLFSRLGSWPPMEKVRRSKKSYDGLRPSPCPSTNSNPHVEIHKITVPLASLEAAYISDTQKQFNNLPQAEAAILRTTKFEAKEEYNSDLESKVQFLQHPWAYSYQQEPPSQLRSPI
ncbi:hypothetical protein DL770_008675 [Monosporascus sp. CRB-9-2]|nr:hypothetical protein DL770_008675 [Monosporascus sp. CRB-9-2]